jgi:phage-related protein
MPTKLPTATAPVEWIGSSKDDLSAFPEDVKDVMGQALFLAQTGGKHRDAKPMTGIKAFKGAGVLEIVDDYDGDAYRAVYTVKFAGVVYVLHAFQKKSKSGIATPRVDIDRVVARLKVAEKHYAATHAPKKAS